MSDTTDVTSDVSSVQAPEETAGPARRRRPGSGLAAMLLPELQSMASSLGISGTARMRKGELIAVIQERQAGDNRVPGPRANEAPREVPARVETPRSEVRAEVRDSDRREEAAAAPTVTRSSRRASRPAGPPEPRAEERAEAGQVTVAERPARTDSARTDGDRVEGARESRGDGERPERGERDNRRESRAERTERAERNDRVERTDRGERGDRNERAESDDDGEGGGRRGRRSRFRDRRRGRGEGGERPERGTGEPQVTEDDVLVPVAGIVDVLDNYAFVRTSGYLAGPNDVYVSMAQIKRYGLRRGDAVTGAVRATRETEQPTSQRRDKYNPLVRLDTINGMDPEEARRRPEFYKLTPLYPQERLRLETEPQVLTTRVIDLVMPIGKGQRALIVSPPKAGKTMVLQSIANAITRNNPECHLMVVLVDERPEEVTDMQRSVKGEVIASTFDRPPSDHTTVSELSIERAKRLVELGHDVVVLLDSITRLGRAYNNASPASGRILSGGIDSTALYPPKRFLGAARNIENGGSLTIIATALVETGSTGDTVIFEEFKGTGNAELKLDRKIADKRVFPAIDIDPSGTRKEEILLAPEELAIVLKLRKVLHALDSQQAIDLLLTQLKKSRTNIEFLMQIAQSTPGE
ncbi:transcription termination factor Rho [Rugosimonospora acidiphila]|uniref:Transcription termination factor Rho n=1 Tax=Rugosimonospora acidiphila TaxID=556531 RepID=A0ABP9RNJ9_9ACTN